MSQLVGSLRRLLSASDAEPAAAAPAIAATAPAMPQPLSAAQFERSLKNLLANGGQAMSGRVHFLNLQKIREQAAISGRARDEAIHQLISSVIHRHLERGDFFTPYGDDCFILIFRRLSGAEANLKCVLIAREVSERLLGANAAPGALDVRVAVAAADGSFALESVSMTEALAQALTREERPLKPVASDPASRADESPEWRAFSMARDRNPPTISYTEGRVRAPAVAVAQSDSFFDVLQEAEEDSAELERELLEQRRREKEAAEAASRKKAKPALRTETEAGPDEEVAWAPMLEQEPLGAPELRLLYRPVLNVAASALGAYAAVLSLLRGGVDVTHDPRHAPLNDPAFTASLDKVLLKKVLPDLVRTAESELRHLLIIPVRSSTLFRTASRLEYLRLCDLIPQMWRKFVVWELIASDVGLIDTQILPAVSTLKPYGRAVILRTSLNFSEYAPLAQMGVHAVGVDLGDAALPEPEIALKFARFSRQARLAGLRTYAARCFSETLLNAAIAAGASYLSGHAIAGRVERPDGVVQLPRSAA